MFRARKERESYKQSCISHGNPRDFWSPQNIVLYFLWKVVKQILPHSKEDYPWGRRGTSIKLLSSLLFYTLIYCFTWEIIYGEITRKFFRRIFIVNIYIYIYIYILRYTWPTTFMSLIFLRPTCRTFECSFFCFSFQACARNLFGSLCTISLLLFIQLLLLNAFEEKSFVEILSSRISRKELGFAVYLCSQSWLIFYLFILIVVCFAFFVLFCFLFFCFCLFFNEP